MQQVQDSVDQLKVQYGSSFIQMQFHILAELIVGGMCSMDDPPPHPPTHPHTHIQTLCL